MGSSISLSISLVVKTRFPSLRKVGNFILLLQGQKLFSFTALSYPAKFHEIEINMPDPLNDQLSRGRSVSKIGV